MSLAQALQLPNLDRGIEPICATQRLPATAGNCDYAFQELQHQRTMTGRHPWGNVDARILLINEGGCKIWVQRASGWTHEERFQMADYIYRLRQVYQKCVAEGRAVGGRIPLGRDMQIDGYVVVSAEEQTVQVAG